MTPRNWVVGLFVSGGVLLFAAGLFLLGNQHQTFAHHVEFATDITDLSGLTEGAQVRVSGMTAGDVTRIAIPHYPASRFRVTFRITDDLRSMIREDSIVSIETEGVVGDTFLSVDTGSTGARPAPARSVLRSREPVQIAELLKQGNAFIKDADASVRDLDGRLDATLAALSGAVARVDDLLGAVKQGRGTAGMLLEDEGLARSVRRSVDHVQHAAATLDRAADLAHAAIADIDSRHLPARLDSAVGAAQEAAAHLDEGTRRASELLASTAPGLEAAVGNMAEDTEALKHEFFFRAYFKKRGYYTLEDIAPEKYRHDEIFSNPANVRRWLPADALFARADDGGAQLTEAGERLLDRTAGELGAQIETDPIVVEGYAGESLRPDRLALARARAIAVRRHLQDHFQLELSRVGFVSLLGAPLPEAGRASFDGVCIVLLKAQH